MRLIDADELIHLYFDDENGKPVFDFVPWEFVENAPTIEADPVVRCKDCKHRILNENYSETDIIYNKAECELDTGDPYQLARNAWDDNWFCADGERRDEVGE